MNTCECEGECVCAEIEKMISEVDSAHVGHTSYMKNDQFDVGIGRNLIDGEFIVTIIFHPAGPYVEDDPEATNVSFGRAETGRLIHLLMRAYHANWSGK